MKKQRIIKQVCRGIFFLVFIFVTISPAFVFGDYSKQNFALNDETVEFLNIENANYYNGSISVTVSTGANVTAKVNGISKIVAQGDTQIFQIVNVTVIVFSLETEDSSQGYFEVNLIIINKGTSDAAYIILAVFGGVVFLFIAISFYIRSKKYQTKPDEDEELADPETLKKRRESAGAEKKFWGLKDKK